MAKYVYQGPDGQQYDLDHLQTQRYEMTLKIEEVRYDVPVLLTFSKHCYSDNQNVDGSKAAPSDPLYCFTDDKGHRVFCEKRWKASIALPDYMRTIMQKGLDCMKVNSGGGIIRIHDNDPNQKYAGWYIFFEFGRAKQGPSLIRVNVTSHHHRRQLPDSIRSTEKFKFDSLMSQWFRHPNREDLFLQLKESPKDDGVSIAAPDAPVPAVLVDQPGTPGQEVKKVA